MTNEEIKVMFLSFIKLVKSIPETSEAVRPLLNELENVSSQEELSKADRDRVLNLIQEIEANSVKSTKLSQKNKNAVSLSNNASDVALMNFLISEDLIRWTVKDDNERYWYHGSLQAAIREWKSLKETNRSQQELLKTEKERCKGLENSNEKINRNLSNQNNEIDVLNQKINELGTERDNLVARTEILQGEKNNLNERGGLLLAQIHSLGEEIDKNKKELTQSLEREELAKTSENAEQMAKISELQKKINESKEEKTVWENWYEKTFGRLKDYDRNHTRKFYQDLTGIGRQLNFLAEGSKKIERSVIKTLLRYPAQLQSLEKNIKQVLEIKPTDPIPPNPFALMISKAKLDIANEDIQQKERTIVDLKQDCENLEKKINSQEVLQSKENNLETTTNTLDNAEISNQEVIAETSKKLGIDIRDQTELAQKLTGSRLVKDDNGNEKTEAWPIKLSEISTPNLRHLDNWYNHLATILSPTGILEFNSMERTIKSGTAETVEQAFQQAQELKTIKDEFNKIKAANIKINNGNLITTNNRVDSEILITTQNTINNTINQARSLNATEGDLLTAKKQINKLESQKKNATYLNYFLGCLSVGILATWMVMIIKKKKNEIVIVFKKYFKQ